MYIFRNYPLIDDDVGFKTQPASRFTDNKTMILTGSISKRELRETTESGNRLVREKRER